MRSWRVGSGDALEEVVSEGGMAAWGGSRRGRKGRVSREKGGVVGRSCGDEVGGRDVLEEKKQNGASVGVILRSRRGVRSGLGGSGAGMRWRRWSGRAGLRRGAVLGGAGKAGSRGRWVGEARRGRAARGGAGQVAGAG